MVDQVATELSAALELEWGVGIASIDRVRGGDVAEAFRVGLDDGRTVFAKTHRSPPPDFFTTEAAGLRWLAEAGAVAVASVVAVDDSAHPAFLALEWIHEGTAPPDEEEHFGRRLARMHLAGAPCFGREDRATTGSRRLPNEPTTTWAEFYGSQRMVPLARLAADGGVLRPSIVSDLERLAVRLDNVGGPPEPAARLHGDLWAGNRLVDRRGRSVLIDPAAHGGHREFDLAMMRLFGGFGEEAFAAYDEVHPLAKGWRERIALHQIAPLVVHAIKFGGGYVGAAEAAVRTYS